MKRTFASVYSWTQRTTRQTINSNITNHYADIKTPQKNVGVNQIGILETIAIANASFSIIKKALENGREAKDLISHVGKFLSAEDELKDAVKRKKASPISIITGGSEGDWEEFAALEKIKEQRAELESWCKLYAPPNTWSRWQSFQNQARVERKEALRLREQQRQELVETLSMVGGIIFAISVVCGAFYLLLVHFGKI